MQADSAVISIGASGRFTTRSPLLGLCSRLGDAMGSHTVLPALGKRYYCLMIPLVGADPILGKRSAFNRVLYKIALDGCDRRGHWYNRAGVAAFASCFCFGAGWTGKWQTARSTRPCLKIH
jgi:hypothetical protein